MPKFIPRQRKHKVLQRQKTQDSKDDIHRSDTNAAEIIQAAGAETAKKKAEMKAALKTQGLAMSGRKQKRLDKYIDKKLKKEENLDLIKKLASAKVDTALLKSSRSLGATKPSKREVLLQALNETQAGVNIKKNQGVLFESQERIENSDDESGDIAERDTASPSILPADTTTPVVGSGLKRSFELGTDGNPIIKKRKRFKRTIRLPKYQPNNLMSWGGFSSNAESQASNTSDSSSNSSSTSPEAMPTESGDNFSTDSSSTDEESIDDTDGDKRKARSSAFKAWASNQVNEALAFTPTATMNDVRDISASSSTDISQRKTISKTNFTAQASSTRTKDVQFEHRPPDIDPLPPNVGGGESRFLGRKTFSVTILRSASIQRARLQLPIVAEEQRIMDAIHNNPTVVIAGETGSGKTTQVPQFLYEGGYGQKDGPYPGMIGVTQPRRVAAVSMAKRVGDELGGDHALRVSHQIRFNSSVGGKTAIKFMTDGILIREVADDFLLSRYSVIIVDEAHERSANTDILVGLLSRIVDLRESMSKEDCNVKPLKLIIMSATLRIQDFLSNTVLFRGGPPPLVQVEGRQYPVVIHFARRTQSDYIEQAFQKICRGHRMLPSGGMLVFLTGQDEITTLAIRIKGALGDIEGGYYPEEAELSTDDDIMDFNIQNTMSTNKSSRVRVLPLYSQLRTEDQLRVFEPPPDGARMIVLATNVAETSLTIPGIRYVFDCGRAKDKKHDKTSGVESFEVGWISKANASQRAGRAGRTGPGHCYRLYSSAIYERDFEEHPEPEILRMPVDGLVLQLKSMELHNVINFPFPTPPDRGALAKAEKHLACLGALLSDGRIAPLGRRLSTYPLSPRFAKMLDIGNQHGCMAFTIILAAALATPNLFVPESQFGLVPPTEAKVYTIEDRLANEAQLERRRDYNRAQLLCSKLSRTSDSLKAFTALQGYLKAASREQYCKEMFLSPKSMGEASNLVTQLTAIVLKNNPVRVSSGSAQLSSPSIHQIAALQQFTVAGFLDRIAILASESPSPPYVGRIPKRAIDVPFLPLFPISKGKKPADSDIRDIAVYVHPSSVLAHLPVKEMPKYIVYSHLQRGAPSSVEGSKLPKTRMHPLTTVSERALASLARGTPLLEYGKPIGKIEEGIGPKGKTRTCFVILNLVGEKGTAGWPLPAQKVVQSRDSRGEWIVEQVLG
ncbi:MAG: hypothetical protein Q9217_001624 [Psora testacea]